MSNGNIRGKTEKGVALLTQTGLLKSVDMITTRN